LPKQAVFTPQVSLHNSLIQRTFYPERSEGSGGFVSMIALKRDFS
jgi:hypothetical protein